MGDVYTHGHDASVLRAHDVRTVASSAATSCSDLRPGVRSSTWAAASGASPPTSPSGSHPGSWSGSTRPRGGVLDARAVGRRPGRGRQRLPGCRSPTTASTSSTPTRSCSTERPRGGAGRDAPGLRPGGVVAVRDADYAAMTSVPEVAGLDAWLALYRAVGPRQRRPARRGPPAAGVVPRAGFTEIDCTASVWTYADTTERRCGGTSGPSARRLRVRPAGRRARAGHRGRTSGGLPRLAFVGRRHGRLVPGPAR